MPAVTFPHGKLQPIVFRPRKSANATPILEDSLKTNAHISPTLFRIDSPPKMPLTVQEPRTPTSIPFDSKAVIDVEYVPMPHRSGAEAQQGPHLLGNRLLIAVWNALDRLFETLEARMSSPHQWPTGAPAPTEMAEPIADGVVFPRRRANARQGPKPCSFPCGRSADMTGWSCPRVLLTQQPHHDLRRCRIMIYAARAYRCWTYPMGTSTRSTNRRR